MRRIKCVPSILCLIIGFLCSPIISRAAIEGKPCTPEPTDMIVEYGDLVTCSIDYVGDTDIFRFSGTSGETVVIRAGGQVPCIELIAPDNSRISACENAFINQIDTTLDETGIHSILVTGWFTTTPSYALTLECLAGPCVDMHTLTVHTLGSGSGKVTSSDGKINCGSDCSAIYNAGAELTLIAEEDAGSIFTGWSGGGCSGTGNCEITMNADVDVTATFTKAPTRLTLLSPNGGEVMPACSTYPICWEAPSPVVKFTLKYSKDNGRTWILIEDNVPGRCFDWRVPKQWGNKNRCFVKVIGYNVSSVKVGADVSDAPFKIEVVKLTSPDEGETFTCGVCNPITWTTHCTKRDVARVRLYYTKNRGVSWNFIGKTSGNPESFDCWVPTCTKPKNCKVKVELRDKSGNILGEDVSDGYFTIQP